MSFLWEEDAESRWEAYDDEMYGKAAEYDHTGKPIESAVVSRAAAHVLKVATIYAIAEAVHKDTPPQVGIKHLEYGERIASHSLQTITKLTGDAVFADANVLERIDIINQFIAHWVTDEKNQKQINDAVPRSMQNGDISFLYITSVRMCLNRGRSKILDSWTNASRLWFTQEYLEQFNGNDTLKINAGCQSVFGQS